MTVRCSLSGHSPARTSVENQGFHFSRCIRCGHDMIRSATSLSAQWRPVPDGFRVDWGTTDLTAFRRRSPIAVRIVAAWDAVIGAIIAVRATLSLLLWRMVDALRGSTRRDADALDAAGRPLGMSGSQRNWNLSVQISVGRSPRAEQPPRSEALVA